MYKEIIDKYYDGCDALRHILVTHSESVARRALQIAALHPELNIATFCADSVFRLHRIMEVSLLT